MVARITLALGVLAACTVVFAVMAWQAHRQTSEAHGLRMRSDQVLSALHELDAATQPQAPLALCAITGGPALNPRDTAAPAWPDLANRLGQIVTIEPSQFESVEAFNANKRDLNLWDLGYAAPLRAACAQGQKLGPAEVQSRVRVAAAQRGRVEDNFKHLRNLTLENGRAHEQRWQAAAQASRIWLSLLAIASVVLGVTAWLVVRSSMLRQVDTQRKLFDEMQERELAREQLAVSQRRMRVLVDHVKDAVIAFDAHGRIQWINPSGETMFGAQRDALVGYPVTLLMPELDAEFKAAAKPDRATVTDEHGLPWVAQHLTLQGIRAPKDKGPVEKITLDVSFVQTRADGHTVGVCVARDLSHIRRMQRAHDAVVSSIRQGVVPKALALQRQVDAALATCVAAAKVDQSSLATASLTEGGGASTDLPSPASAAFTAMTESLTQASDLAKTVASLLNDVLENGRRG